MLKEYLLYSATAIGAGVFGFVVHCSIIDKEENFAMVPLSATQQEQIAFATQAICDTDKDTCNTLRPGSIEFWGLELPRQFAIWPGSVQRRAYTHLNPTRVKITQQVFADNTALAVVLYHEAQHIRYSDPALYTGKATKERCEDHNRVKVRTQAHVAKLDDWFRQHPSVEFARPVTYYAQDAGNVPNECT